MLAAPDPGLVLPSRQVAGQLLAERLREFRGERPIILGVVPGGVPVGFEIARVLGWSFDAIVAVKVSAPESARRALGASAEFGAHVMSDRRLEQTEHVAGDLAAEGNRADREVSRLSNLYRQGRGPPELGNRMVVVATDGVVEPLLVRAALRGVSSQSPQRVVFVAGVMARVTRVEVHRDVAEAIVLREPREVFSVAEWYREYPPVSDTEIQAMLRAPPHPR